MAPAQISAAILIILAALGLAGLADILPKRAARLPWGSRTAFVLACILGSPLFGILVILQWILRVQYSVEKYMLKRQLRRILDQADELERQHSEWLRQKKEAADNGEDHG